MGFHLTKLRSLFGSGSRRRVEEDSQRFGGRASVLQVGALEVGDRAVAGVIQNVGLRGAFFAGGWLPAVGDQGTLRGPDGHGVKVRVVWRRRRGNAGVGLAFDS